MDFLDMKFFLVGDVWFSYAFSGGMASWFELD